MTEVHLLFAQARNAAQMVVGQSAALRVLWTGARVWERHYDQMRRLVLPVAMGLIKGADGRKVSFMHGAARGLDSYVHELSQRQNVWGEEIYPIMPEERVEFGDRAGIERDRRMIENNPMIVVGLPHKDSRTGGTWSCLRQAHEARIPAYAVRELLGLGWRMERYTPRGGLRQEEMLF